MSGDAARDSASSRSEQKALALSTIGYLGMAALGIGFAIGGRSEAILLDGVYSFVSAGAGVMLWDGAVRFLREDGSSETSVGEVGFTVTPSLYAGYDLFRERLHLWVQAEGIPGIDASALDLQAGAQVRLGCQWDVGVGYRWTGTTVDTSDIVNDAETNEVFLALARSF